MKNSLLVAVCCLLLTVASCSRDNLCDTPFGMGASIDIYQPDFSALLTVGGTVTINRGYKGIFIRRTSYSDFVPTATKPVSPPIPTGMAPSFNVPTVIPCSRPNTATLSTALPLDVCSTNTAPISTAIPSRYTKTLH